MTNFQEPDVKIQQGAIGFFDILGYKGILKNNKMENELIRVVINVLKKINKFKAGNLSRCKFAFGTIGESVENKFPQELDAYIKRLIFSDTIILSLDFSLNFVTPKNKILLWFCFLESCRNLYNEMFKNGLPLRGAISFGRYAIYENSFIGIPFLEAYEPLENLELSACVLKDEVVEQIRDGFSLHEPNEYFIKYPIQTKEGEKEFFTLNANPCDSNKDIREQVISSFNQHNKEIAESVKSKVDNTVQWLTYLRMQKNENKA